MEWMHHHTNVPVPTVVSHDASRVNPVGFEWILMTKLPGKPLADAWRSLSYSAKGLVKQFAEYSSSLFKNQLNGIRNIYAALLPKVDRIVSMHFFRGDHIHQDVSRGPFSSTRSWMDARLALSEHGCRSTLAKYSDRDDIDTDDEDALDDAQRTLKIVNRLKTVVGQIFSIGHLDDEPSILFHDDLSQHNILVDDGGGLIAVLDWECVSALPLWKACCYPSFLEGRPREKKPELARYKRGANGEATDLYWDHMMEYELTTLRRIFLDEMARLELGWMEIFNSSQFQRDLDLAVQSCDSEFLASDINEWIDEIVAGRSNIRSLQERIDES